jgi:hypothetical protein
MFADENEFVFIGWKMMETSFKDGHKFTNGIFTYQNN